MLVEASLNDSQVPYWEAAKYVARLRALKTDANVVLLKTILEAGHGGASGRYDALKELAFTYTLHPGPGRAGAVRPDDLQLFAACVAIWGSTWIAITFQLGSVAPEASVFYRFLLASALLFAWCLARGLPLRFPRREHLWIALPGRAHVQRELRVRLLRGAVRGLGPGGGRLFREPAPQHDRDAGHLRSPMTLRVAAGAALGIVGITLVFWPEFSHLRADRNVALGALFTMAAVVLSVFSNMAAHRNHEAGHPVWQSMAWGMLYGALFTLAIALALGRPLGFEATPAYVLSLLYLAVFGSILAFGSFLTLMGRVGAARAGYIGVMVPIVALAVSSVFEGYRWEMLALVGVAISVAGNVIILRRQA